MEFVYMAIALVFGLGAFFFWLVTLIHIAINDDLGFLRKLLWAFLMFVPPILIWVILYYLIEGE